MKSIIQTIALCLSSFTPIFSQFANDIIIDHPQYVNEKNAKISTAFNGWIFVAHTTNNNFTGDIGYTIRKSIDRGQTWTDFFVFTPSIDEILAIDVEVTGNTLANLKVFVVTIEFKPTTSIYRSAVDKFDGVSGVYLGEVYSKTHINRLIDVDMASDNVSQAAGTTGGSIGFLFSKNAFFDSIIFIGSVNGGNTWDITHTVASTPLFFNKVALSYGKSQSGSNGRYFAAWDRKLLSGAPTGNLYTSRNTTMVSEGWKPPINLDSLGENTIGRCRNPRIATMIEQGLDNDSAGVTAIVLFDRDYNGSGTDYDVLGFYNKVAHFTNHWNRLDVANTANREMFSDILYNHQDHLFHATYFDSTENKLKLKDNNVNLLSPSIWIASDLGYNDASAGIAPYPRLSFNAEENGIDIVWSVSSNTSGISMFDASYRTQYLNVSDLDLAEQDLLIFPNPAQDFVNIEFGVENDADVIIELLDATGRVVIMKNETAKSGRNSFKLTFGTMQQGMYTLKIIHPLNVLESKVIVK
jgi:hypothetical protein